MSALKEQVGGDHYKSMPIQPMEYSMANGLDACQHTIIKYVTRFRQKGGIQDLEKARHVIDMLIEFERKKETEAMIEPLKNWSKHTHTKVDAKATGPVPANDNAPPSIFDADGGGWTLLTNNPYVPSENVDYLFSDGHVVHSTVLSTNGYVGNIVGYRAAK